MPIELVVVAWSIELIVIVSVGELLVVDIVVQGKLLVVAELRQIVGVEVVDSVVVAVNCRDKWLANSTQFNLSH